MEVTELNRAESDESDELRKERKVEAAGIIKVCNAIHLNVLFEQFRFFFYYLSIRFECRLTIQIHFTKIDNELWKSSFWKKVCLFLFLFLEMLYIVSFCLDSFMDEIIQQNILAL